MLNHRNREFSYPSSTPFQMCNQTGQRCFPKLMPLLTTVQVGRLRSKTARNCLAEWRAYPSRQRPSTTGSQNSAAARERARRRALAQQLLISMRCAQKVRTVMHATPPRLKALAFLTLVTFATAPLLPIQHICTAKKPITKDGLVQAVRLKGLTTKTDQQIETRASPLR